jgi:hypothetical protein
VSIASREDEDHGAVRIDASTYRYESASGFVAELRVNADGLVTLYSGFCEAEAAGGAS